jgi:predicted GNAT family acetyltransferase
MNKSQNQTLNSAVRDNTALQRFEMNVEGSVVFANYRIDAGTVTITHTETPAALRGRGIASQLVRGALELIDSRKQKIIAGCSFVAGYLAKHPEWQKLSL